VADAHHKHRHRLVLNIDKDAVIADPIPPDPCEMRALQRPAHLKGIVKGRDTKPKERHDALGFFTPHLGRCFFAASETSICQAKLTLQIGQRIGLLLAACDAFHHRFGKIEILPILKFLDQRLADISRSCCAPSLWPAPQAASRCLPAI
jgi:hypothetical protein